MLNCFKNFVQHRYYILFCGVAEVVIDMSEMDGSSNFVFWLVIQCSIPAYTLNSILCLILSLMLECFILGILSILEVIL